MTTSEPTPFERAVAKLLGMPPDATNVNIVGEATGGGRVQIGDYTWDENPADNFSVSGHWTNNDGTSGSASRYYGGMAELINDLIDTETPIIIQEAP